MQIFQIEADGIKVSESIIRNLLADFLRSMDCHCDVSVKEVTTPPPLPEIELPDKPDAPKVSS